MLNHWQVIGRSIGNPGKLIGKSWQTIGKDFVPVGKPFRSPFYTLSKALTLVSKLQPFNGIEQHIFKLSSITEGVTKKVSRKNLCFSEQKCIF
jgi:hypothetical protein